ncbi:MAG: hypothetical protein EB015_19935, partial [Methylocystaceae bacterium]|nr:hypothetical protein [Methylocystaceae bacterium]
DLKTPKALTFLEDLLSANYNEKTLNLVRCIYDQAIELRDSDLLSDNARHSIVQIISRSLKLLTSYGRRDISDTYESEDQKVRKYLSSKLVYDNPASLLFVMEC